VICLIDFESAWFFLKVSGVYGKPNGARECCCHMNGAAVVNNPVPVVVLLFLF